jgi:hypothetical protein
VTPWNDAVTCAARGSRLPAVSVDGFGRLGACRFRLGVIADAGAPCDGINARHVDDSPSMVGSVQAGL